MNRFDKLLYHLRLIKFSWDPSKFKLRVPGTHPINNLFTSLGDKVLMIFNYI